MIFAQPDPTDVMSSTRTTTGTMVTVPAGRWYTGTAVLSASVSVAGTSIPTITVNGTNAAPASGTVIHRINLTGLALTTVASTATIDFVVVAPPENSITLDFTAGASGTSSGTVNGFLFG